MTNFSLVEYSLDELFCGKSNHITAFFSILAVLSLYHNSIKINMIWKILCGSLAVLVLIIYSGCGPTEPPSTPVEETVDCEISFVFERPFEINYPSLWTSSNCAQSYIQTAASPLCDLDGGFITACDPNQGLCPSDEHVIELEVIGTNGYYAVVNITNTSPQGGQPDCPVIIEVPTDQDSEITATWFDLCCPNLGSGRRITWVTVGQGGGAFISQQAAQANNAFANVSLEYAGTQNYPCF